MQYIFLKNILETILSSYECPECHNKTNELALQITGISTHGVDLHVHCHVCGSHSQLNAEINTIASQMLETESGKKQFEEFVSQGGTIGAVMKNLKGNTNGVNSNAIKEEDIMRIHRDIQNAKSINDIIN